EDLPTFERPARRICGASGQNIWFCRYTVFSRTIWLGQKISGANCGVEDDGVFITKSCNFFEEW
ncbi:MAG: hypothetical protein CSA20_02750, partial [Deltaproteobacteria bacterium]